MAQCSGINAKGGRCGGQAIKGSTYCFTHAPDKALERQKRNVKGGKSGGNGRESAAKTLWDATLRVAERVDAGELHTSKGNTMIRAYSLLLDITKLALEQAEVEINQKRLELDIEERTEMKRRLRELEEAIENDESRWDTRVHR